MSSFDKILGRLKSFLAITSDIEVAKLFGLSQQAFASRKKRNSFPEENLKELIQREPWRDIDFQFIMTGELSTFEQINRRFKSETGLRSDLDVCEALNISTSDFVNARLNNAYPIESVRCYAKTNNKISIDYLLSGKTATVSEYGCEAIEMLEQLVTLPKSDQQNIIQQVKNLYALHRTIKELTQQGLIITQLPKSD